MFKGNKLCIPSYGVWELLVRGVHNGGLVGHFGAHKTMDILSEHFYWSCMIKDVQGVVSKCPSYQRAKSTFHKGL